MSTTTEMPTTTMRAIPMGCLCALCGIKCTDKVDDIDSIPHG